MRLKRRIYPEGPSRKETHGTSHPPPPARGKAAHITVYEKSDAVGGRGRAAYRGGERGGGLGHLIGSSVVSVGVFLGGGIDRSPRTLLSFQGRGPVNEPALPFEASNPPLTMYPSSRVPLHSCTWHPPSPLWVQPGCPAGCGPCS